MVEKCDKIVKLLGMLQVQGYENCAIVVACINEVNQIKKEVATYGNTNSQPRVD